MHTPVLKCINRLCWAIVWLFFIFFPVWPAGLTKGTWHMAGTCVTCPHLSAKNCQLQPEQTKKNVYIIDYELWCVNHQNRHKLQKWGTKVSVSLNLITYFFSSGDIFKSKGDASLVHIHTCYNLSERSELTPACYHVLKRIVFSIPHLGIFTCTPQLISI